MKTTITIARENQLNRLFTVKLEAAPENPIADVSAEYDGFTLPSQTLPAPVTMFERVYRKQESNSPGTHSLFVTARFQDGSTESAIRTWDES